MLASFRLWLRERFRDWQLSQKAEQRRLDQAAKKIQLEVDPLERRWVPNDVFGLLRTVLPGLALGLAGQKALGKLLDEPAGRRASHADVEPRPLHDQIASLALSLPRQAPTAEPAAESAPRKEQPSRTPAESGEEWPAFAKSLFDDLNARDKNAPGTAGDGLSHGGRGAAGGGGGSGSSPSRTPGGDGRGARHGDKNSPPDVVVPPPSGQGTTQSGDRHKHGGPKAGRPAKPGKRDSGTPGGVTLLGGEAGPQGGEVTLPAELDPQFAAQFLAFEANEGQAPAEVQYLTRAKGYTAYLTGAEAVVVLAPTPQAREQNPESPAQDVLRLQFPGANAAARAEGLGLLPSRSNYFLGSDRSAWHGDVAQFGQVAYRSLFPGVDLTYRGGDGQRLRFDFTVAPDADVSAIGMRFAGVSAVSVNRLGELVLTTAHGQVTQRAPVLFQDVGGSRVTRSGRYVLREGNEVGFQVDSYDHSRPLVIDPTLDYGSYLGGSSTDQANGVAVDLQGNVVTVGTTLSTNFPTGGPLQSTLGSFGTDAFVTKLTAKGVLVYSTYLGGSSGLPDEGLAVAVDAAGNAYVTGAAGTGDFPTTPGAFQTAIGVGTDAFVTKLNPAGNALVFSTYLGSTFTDVGRAIAVDAAGAVFVAGETNSLWFPTTSGALDTTYAGDPEDTSPDAFVTKLHSHGGGLVYSTYLGGTGSDVAHGIAVGPTGTAYVVGSTAAGNFPTESAYQSTAPGGTNAFVTALNASGTGFVYSTYLGGAGTDEARAVAVNAGGEAFVTGLTQSSGFPTTAGAFDTGLGGGQDAFVTKFLAGGGATLGYSTFLGGASGSDAGHGIGLDLAGNAHVTGVTAANNFPTVSATQSTSAGAGDAFVTWVNPGGTTLTFSTYLGGSGADQGNALAVDQAGGTAVVGSTASTNFPTAGTPVQGSNAGGTDAFLVYYGDSQPPPKPAITAITTDTGSSDSDFITKDKTLVISGTAVANATVKVYDAGQFLRSALANGAGSWSLDYTDNDLAGGNHPLTATATVAGRTSLPSATRWVLVDITPPTVTLTAPANTTDLTPDVNVSASDPNPNGAGVANGAAVALDVDLNNDNDYADPGETNHTVGALVNGSAVLTPTLALGTFRLRARVSDKAGNEGPSGNWTMTIKPPPPAITAVATDTGYSGADFITNDQTLQVSGIATAGATVELTRVGVGVLGTATANGAGLWTYNYTATTLAEGIHAFTAKQTVTGHDSDPSLARLVWVDLTPPAVTLSANGSGATNATVVTVNATDLVGLPPGAPVTLDVDLDNDGNYTDPGEAGYDSATLVGGTVTFTVSPDLPVATVRLRARVTDKAGNEGASSAVTVVVLPAAPPITAVSTDSGSSASDFITNDQTLTISGTADAGASVAVTRVGVGVLGSATANGSGLWTYDYTATSLPEGNHTFTAQATLSGQTGAVGPARLVTVDLTAPAVGLTAPEYSTPSETEVSVTATDAVGFPTNALVTLDIDLNNDNDFTDSGEAGYDTATLTVTGTSATATFTVSPDLPLGTVKARARVTDLAGNEGTSATATIIVVSSLSTPDPPAISAVSTDSGSSAADFITNDQTLTITGTSVANGQVEVFDGGGSLGTTTANSSGDWSFDHTGTSLAQGAHPLTAKVTLLGQTSAPSDVKLLRVDLTAPAVTVSAPAEAPTDDTEITVTATDAVGIPSGAVVTLDVDLNNDNDFTDSGETGYDSATLTVTGNNGTATFTVSPDLPVGTVKLRARVTDKAGNEGTSGTSTLTVLPAAPEITGVATDTGSSASDLVTYDQTLVVSGTSDPGASITVYEGGVSRGSTTADGSGAWSFNYTGTTLAEGDHGFTATATVSGQTSFHSALALVTVDLTPPDVVLEVPPSGVYEPDPEVTVTATDLVDLPDDATVTLDVDLNNDGDFTDPGEAGYQTEPLVGGTATFVVTPELPEGTSGLRARVKDLAGNEGSSQAGATVDVLTEVRVSVTDPYNGDSLLNQGNVSVSHGLDLDGSPGGGVALVYESRRVDVRPIVQLTLRTDASQALPATISAELFWDGGGSPVASQSFVTTGFSPGDLVTLALQVPTAQTVVGRHAWVLDISLAYGSPVTFTLDDTLYLVPAADSPYGSGWSFSHVDRLYSVSADANGPAGMLRAFGSGGWAFYEGVDSFTSPPGDNGTLTRATAGGVSTYTYAAATGEQWTFNAAGLQTRHASADGQFTRSSTYTDGDSDGQADDLATQTNPDGTVATFTYASNKLRTVASEGPRTVTLTHSGSDLTQVTDPGGGAHVFGYDFSHRLTGETFGVLANYRGYGSHGLATTLTWGSTSSTALIPSISRGLGALAAGPPTARTSDPLTRVTTSGLDRNGRPLSLLAADTGFWEWGRDGQGRVVTATDPLLRTTTLTRDAQGFVTREDFPDGTHRDYQYQAAFHALVGMTDERGSATAHGYDAQGHLVTTTNALNQVTTYAYNADGTLQKVTDALNHTTTFLYDTRRRLTTVTNALGGLVTTAYDAAGNATAVTDPLGVQTRLAYDGLGRPVQKVEAYGTAVQRTTTTAYDAAGNVTSVQDPLGLLAQNFYDSRGLLVSRRVGWATPREFTNLYVYDEAGQLTAERDPNAAWSYTAYDAVGRQTAATDPLGYARETHYDTAGQVAYRQDQLGQVTRDESDSRGRVTSVTDALNHRTTFGYDAAGNQTAVTDPLGRTSTTVYDELGRPAVAITPLGYRTTTAYDAAGNVTAVTDPRSVLTRYEYDELNRLVRTIQAHGTSLQRTFTTAYDAAGNVTAVTDPLGVQARYEFDALGRTVKTVGAYGTAVERTTTTAYDGVDNLLWVKDALGRTSTPVYDALHRVVGVTDPLNRTSTIVRDAVGRTVGSVNPMGQATVTGRDPLGRPSVVRDPVWNTTGIGYDRAGNRTGVTDPRGNASRVDHDPLGRPTGQTDALSNAATTVYDAAGQSTVTIDPLGNRTTFAYDAMGRLTSVQQPLIGTATTVYDENSNVVATVTPLGQRTTFVYDELNRHIATIDPVGQRTTSVYDAADRVTVVVNALNQRTTFTFDALGRQTVTVDPLGNRSTTVYDASDQVIATIDPRGYRTTYGYDAAGRLTQTQDALGNLTTTAYDDAGRVVATIDARGYRTTFSYDGAGRQTGVTDPLGNTTATAYDQTGNVVSRTDASGYSTLLGYDELNRATAVTKPTGGTATIVYDTAGRVLARVDEMGNPTTYAYDSAWRRTSVTDARGGITTTTYDGNGNVSARTDPAGNRTTFVYDSSNRLLEEIDPLNKSATFAYDALGRQTSQTDRLGRRRDYGYDDAGRQSGETWVNAGGSVADRVTFTYDQAGNLLSAADGDGAYTYTYDELDRPKTQKGMFGTTLTFSYDGVGNRTKVEDNFGGVLSSVYNAANLLTSRQMGGSATPVRIDMGYTPRLQVATLTRYSDLAGTTKVGESLYGYDGSGRITSLQHKNGSGTALATYSYSYDNADRVLTEATGGGTKTYTYDATNEVTNDSTATYTYDANGNRTMSGYATTTGNRMTNDGVYTYTYDDEGNLTKKSKGSAQETWTYGYDHRNQLVWAEKRATDGGTLQMRADYKYDAFNRRIEKAVDADGAGAGGTTTERFAYDGSNPWADLDGTNALTTRRVFGDQVDQLWCKVAGATVTHYLTERLGSVVDLTNGSGAVVNHLGYDAFGKILTESSPGNGDRYVYAGFERDTETGNYYSVHRYYDPRTGRWLTPDPIGFSAGDGNLYRYVFNNATNATDPDGLEIFAHGGLARDSVLKGLKFDAKVVAINLGDYRRAAGMHPGGTANLYYIRHLGMMPGKSPSDIFVSYRDLFVGKDKVVFVPTGEQAFDGDDGVRSELFKPDTLSAEQKVKIFYADYLAGFPLASRSMGYDTFRATDWKKTGLEGVLIQVQLKYGYLEKMLNNTSLSLDKLVESLGSGTVEAAADRLWQALKDNQYQVEVERWEKHSIGWLSRHPEYVVGDDTALQELMPKYAEIYDQVVEHAEWGTHLVVTEWFGQAGGLAAGGVFGIIRGLRNIRLGLGTGKGPRVGVMPGAEARSGPPRIGPRWQPRDIMDPRFKGGCHDVAKQIKAHIGGEIFEIKPIQGAQLGPYRGVSHNWPVHAVVVKDGRVYDAFTGVQGATIAEYKALWKFGSDINWLF